MHLFYFIAHETTALILYIHAVLELSRVEGSTSIRNGNLLCKSVNLALEIKLDYSGKKEKKIVADW